MADEGQLDVADGDRLEITFDGSTCTYRGPDRLDAGPSDFSFVNDSAFTAIGVVLVITDDRTYDDVEELSRSDPAWNGDDEWADLISPSAGVPSGRSYEWVTDLGAGSHYVVCMDNALERFFYGGGFTVDS